MLDNLRDGKDGEGNNGKTKGNLNTIYSTSLKLQSYQEFNNVQQKGKFVNDYTFKITFLCHLLASIYLRVVEKMIETFLGAFNNVLVH